MESVAIATHDELQSIVANEKVLGPAIAMDLFPNLMKPLSQQQEFSEIVDNLGNHALIKVWLIQLGTKQVIKSNPKDAQVNTDATTTICIKVFADLVEISIWNEITRSPVKVTLKGLWGESKISVADVWSRRFYNVRNPKIPTEPSNADAFSVFVRIDKEEVKTWRVKSGSTQQPVFVNENDNKSLRVFWVGKELRHAHVRLNRMSETDTAHLGIVVGKGLDSYGIRFMDKDFKDAWATLKGDHVDPPKQINETCRFWIENFPAEFGHKHVCEWAEKVNWAIKPMKKIRQHWLVSATEAPKDELSANKVPLLIYPLVKVELGHRKVMAGRIFTPKQPRMKKAQKLKNKEK